MLKLLLCINLNRLEKLVVNNFFQKWKSDTSYYICLGFLSCLKKFFSKAFMKVSDFYTVLLSFLFTRVNLWFCHLICSPFHKRSKIFINSSEQNICIYSWLKASTKINFLFIISTKSQTPIRIPLNFLSHISIPKVIRLIDIVEP